MSGDSSKLVASAMSPAVSTACPSVSVVDGTLDGEVGVVEVRLGTEGSTPVCTPVLPPVIGTGVGTGVTVGRAPVVVVTGCGTITSAHKAEVVEPLKRIFVRINNCHEHKRGDTPAKSSMLACRLPPSLPDSPGKEGG